MFISYKYIDKKRTLSLKQTFSKWAQKLQNCSKENLGMIDMTGLLKQKQKAINFIKVASMLKQLMST